MMMMDTEGCNQSSSGLIDYLSNGTSSSVMESNMSAIFGAMMGSSDDQGNDQVNILPENFHDGRTLPLYLQVTCLILFIVIFTVGTVGNIMVTLVISCSRDMRTSTNIFLVNLSIADLLVLVICTPTALIEVTYHPDRWVLGFYMCKYRTYKIHTKLQ